MRKVLITITLNLTDLTDLPKENIVGFEAVKCSASKQKFKLVIINYHKNMNLIFY